MQNVVIILAKLLHFALLFCIFASFKEKRTVNSEKLLFLCQNAKQVFGARCKTFARQPQTFAPHAAKSSHVRRKPHTPN